MFLALFALAVADAGVADAGTAPPNPPLICRKAEKEVGSHIRTGKRCRTAEEWEREDAERERKPADMRVTEGQSTPTGLPGSPH